MKQPQHPVDLADRDETVDSAAAPQSAASRNLLVWAAAAHLAPQQKNVVLWQETAAGTSFASVLDYLETHGDEVRRRYLAWTHELGQMRVGQRRLCERFEARRGESLWELSLFFEQSPWKQQSLDTLLKVMAFELLLDQQGTRGVEFVGGSRELAVTLGAICRQRGITFTWDARMRRRPLTWRSVLRWTPKPLLALAQLARLAWQTAFLRARFPAGQTATGRRVLIVGPLFNYTVDAAGQHEFVSQYWTDLPRMLAAEGYQVGWLHYYYPHGRLPNARAAAGLLPQINARQQGEAHALLESYLSISGFVRVTWRWLAIMVESAWIGLRLRAHFRQAPSRTYWPLIRHDWARAFRGYGCVESLCFSECFEHALRTLPHQDECLLLMENQGWERALARSWRKYGHGRLTAVAHSTVRFWDLRYFSDPRRYDGACCARAPAPDVVALNGPAATAEYMAIAGERETVVECEALRYLHLEPLPPGSARSGRGGPLRLLILGDYTRERTDELMSLVERACASPQIALDIQVKAHPACPVRGPGSALHFTSVTEPVARLAAQADLVLASNTTSATMDAYVSGAHVAVHLDPCGLNFSPLRGMSGVDWVRTPADLKAVMERLAQGEMSEERAPPERGYFAIDRALPRWRRHFGLRSAAADSILPHHRLPTARRHNCNEGNQQ